jgi:hypothetical protein
MHGRVVVQIVIDAVAPRAAPPVLFEQVLDGLFRLLRVELYNALLDEEGKDVVRHESVVLEHDRERLGIVADDGHGRPPSSNRPGIKTAQAPLFPTPVHTPA